jgi:hypothetical protein
MEPLQDQAVEMIAELEEEKKNMEQTQAECTSTVKKEFIAQNLEALTENVAQVQT